MKTALIAFCILAAIVVLPGAVEAQPDGFGRCVIVEEEIGYVVAPGTPVDGTEVSRPALECYW